MGTDIHVVTLQIAQTNLDNLGTGETRDETGIAHKFLSNLKQVDRSDIPSKSRV